MLVLSRKKNQIIDLTLPDGTNIPLVIVEVRGDKVRLGIEAPKEVKVHRREVSERIVAEQLAAELPTQPEMRQSA